MTCDFFMQPLNHFELPQADISIYAQRFCVFNDFVRKDLAKAPVFFYTGNESPLEQYINATGFMWELGEKMNAQIIFVEHRYEGESKPPSNISNCMAFSSSIQAIADYANFIEKYIHQSSDPMAYRENPKRPVIAFGGSYGGMLSAWLRMKYPNTIAGAIAASAPIWGFPLNFPEKIDTAYSIISDGFRKSYPPTEPPSGENHCARNFLVAQPLLKVIGEMPQGLEWLESTFTLCKKLDDAESLLSWIQSPWFDLAEGSFPYPSSYVTYALTHRDVKLPAWPLQAACWTESGLYRDYGFTIDGSTRDVKFDILLNNSSIVSVDWDIVTFDRDAVQKFLQNSSVFGLMSSLRDAVAIWYNVTKDVECFDLVDAPNAYFAREETSLQRNLRFDNSKQTRSEECRAKIEESGSWPALCCNEDMDLIITEASGLGSDIFWPPSHGRGTKSHDDIIWSNPNATFDPFCEDPSGAFGFRKVNDPWARWMDAYYGGTQIEAHSNIIFSNGLLDPWSGAGVYAKGKDPWGPSSTWSKNASLQRAPGLYVQNISGAEDDRLVAVIMEHGGHHTDLMYSDKADPPCIVEGRKIEAAYIQRWINEWWKVQD